VNTLVADGEALTAAHRLADRIAANGPLATIARKKIMMESRSWPGNPTLY
jgi:enoyl-CoA hydratase